MDVVTAKKPFPEPQVVIIGHGESSQGISVAKNKILLEVGSFNILEGLTTLISTYYVTRKFSPVAQYINVLQEVVLTQPAQLKNKLAC